MNNNIDPPLSLATLDGILKTRSAHWHELRSMVKEIKAIRKLTWDISQKENELNTEEREYFRGLVTSLEYGPLWSRTPQDSEYWQEVHHQMLIAAGDIP